MGVYIGDKAKRDVEDKAYLCSIFCSCNINPIKGVQGQDLKQRCASETLRNEDRAANWQGKFKAEVPYDMKGKYTEGKGPPGRPYPIMSKKHPTRPSSHWMYHVQKSGGWEQYTQYDVRIPDVVAVRDVLSPPTQENITKIYEMKFPGDRWGKDQKKDYKKILGALRKRDLVVLNKETCGCSPEEKPEPKPENSWFENKRPVFIKSDTDIQSMYDQLHGSPAPARKAPWSNGCLPIPLPLPGGLRFPFKP